jgi:hypothetical protein
VNIGDRLNVQQRLTEGYRYTDVQMYRRTDVQMYRCTDIQMYRCTGKMLHREDGGSWCSVKRDPDMYN